MMKPAPITLEQLKEKVIYDPSTGVFTWIGRGRGFRTGVQAGHVDNKTGYRSIRINGREYYAQRLAWFWVNGTFPKVLRFLNGNQDDCRIENLLEIGTGIKTDHRSSVGRSDYQKQYRSTRRDRFRGEELERKFGIGLREYEAMFVAQSGKCAICNCGETAARKGKPISLAVDHDHSTGKVRGLLCRDCNLGIGKLKDDRNIMLSAVKYLDMHSDQNSSVTILNFERNH